MKSYKVIVLLVLVLCTTDVWASHPDKKIKKAKGEFYMEMPGKGKMVQQISDDHFIFKCKGTSGVCFRIWSEDDAISGDRTYRLLVIWSDGSSSMWKIVDPNSVIPVGNDPGGDPLFEVTVLELLEQTPPIE